MDGGYSGGNFNRPGFIQLIKDVEQGKVDCIITKDLSRLGRDHIDTGRYVERYFPEHNIRYIAIQEQIDTGNSENSNNEYDNRVKTAKENWLKTHLKSVQFDFVEIVPYGTPKNEGRNGILFDDEKPNRDSWNGVAHNVENIMKILKGLEI